MIRHNADSDQIPAMLVGSFHSEVEASDGTGLYAVLAKTLLSMLQKILEVSKQMNRHVESD